MKVITSYKDIPDTKAPCGLTLGSFDGMHLGHQTLISELKELSDDGSAAVFTFENHPSHILKSRPPTPLLCTLEHKLLLLKKAEVDLVLLRSFDEEFSQITYEDFLKQLKKHYPFSVFVLGKGASFGKDKLGDEKRIGELSKKMKFKTKYLKKFALDKQPISSGYIRHLIDGGDFIFASKLLGRPFSIYATPHRNKDHSDTYTISLNGLCMPPHGTYAISAFIAEQEYEGTAIVDRNQQILNFKVNNLPNKLEKSPVEIIFQKYFSSNLA